MTYDIKFSRVMAALMHTQPIHYCSEHYILHVCTHTHSMSRLGMNTYLYAPKDDDKHRACWRDLYSLEEADHLAQLIREAQNRGISFIYAIAPGLDITFSNNRDVDFLKRKLDQVCRRWWGWLGCRDRDSLVPRPHPLTRRNGLVDQVKFLGLAHTFATM